MRNEFEARYFPLKRAFRMRSDKYRRCRSLKAKRLRFAGKKLTMLKIAPGAPTPGVKRKRIVFVSDWHWHDSARNKQILAEFTGLMKQFPPDVLLLGGDLCDDAEYLDTLPELLKQLTDIAPCVIAVNGNWETGKRWLNEEYFAELYRQYGIDLLENRALEYGGFRFFGLPDISSINFRKLPELSAAPELTDILLVHSPDGVIAADHEGFLRNFRFAFCGHTHGGQVRLPLIGALYCPGFYQTKYASGIFERRGLKIKMIVSSGIGEHANTRRFLCPPEVIIAEFR